MTEASAVRQRAGTHEPHSARQHVEAALAAVALPACDRAFLSIDAVRALAAADAADRSAKLGEPVPPLAGLSVSIKDLFDVEGEVTTAGSTALADADIARHDAPAVARLRRAGAALIGRTNMTEFAFSGVGINPHHGTPANAAIVRRAGMAPTADEARIPGGSTSGGATSVAAGAAWAALGSDTGGSIRIPAALQGLVGFKSTARRVPTAGSIPLSPTLDTVAAVTRSVADAIRVHEVLAARSVPISGRSVRGMRFAVPRTLMLDALDRPVMDAFDNAIASLRGAGARVDEIELSALAEVARINAGGGFSALESWLWHREMLERRGDRYDPRVAARIRRGATITATDRRNLVASRTSWIAGMESVVASCDALLSPTVPCVAPLLAPLLDDDAAFFAVNARLLRNPSVVNLLDGCAISLPCAVGDGLPVGLMVWSGAMRDDAVLDAALAIEAVLGVVPHD